MVATDIKTVIKAAWDDDIATEGIIEYAQFESPDAVFYGVIIEPDALKYQQKGFTHKKTDAFGYKGFLLYVKGFSDDDATAETRANNQISALIKIADTFTGNAEFTRLELDLENIKVYPGANEWEIQLMAYGVRNNKDLYT